MANEKLPYLLHSDGPETEGLIYKLAKENFEGGT
jgi:hypothetical protein